MRLERHNRGHGGGGGLRGVVWAGVGVGRIGGWWYDVGGRSNAILWATSSFRKQIGVDPTLSSCLRARNYLSFLDGISDSISFFYRWFSNSGEVISARGSQT